MATRKIVYNSHADWLAGRDSHIGSSEVPTILGVSSYDTPYQLWLRKTGQIPTQEDNSNILLRAGHILEGAVAKFCAEEAELDIIKSSEAEFIVQNTELPYMAVSPDRFAWRKGMKHTRENKVIIECKTTQKDIDPDDIPMYWFTQVMYQLSVCEMDMAALAWLVRGGASFGFRWLARDDEFFRDVIYEEVNRFWTDCIIGGKEPPMTNLADIVLKYPKSKIGKVITATPEIIEQYEELKATSAEIKRLESLKENIEAHIKGVMLDAESITGDDNKTLISWKSSAPKQVFDATAFRADNPLLYEKYLVSKNSSRRFLIK